MLNLSKEKLEILLRCVDILLAQKVVQGKIKGISKVDLTFLQVEITCEIAMRDLER